MYQMDDRLVQFTERQNDDLQRVPILIHKGMLNSGDQLSKALLGLSVSLICYSDYAHVKLSLIYFTGVLGYNVKWKQWRLLQDYTPILAGLQFYICFIMLEAVLPMKRRGEFDEQLEMIPVNCFYTVREKWLIVGKVLTI
jgi:hypothetical protein